MIIAFSAKFGSSGLECRCVLSRCEMAGKLRAGEAHIMSSHALEHIRSLSAKPCPSQSFSILHRAHNSQSSFVLEQSWKPAQLRTDMLGRRDRIYSASFRVYIPWHDFLASSTMNGTTQLDQHPSLRLPGAPRIFLHTFVSSHRLEEF